MPRFFSKAFWKYIDSVIGLSVFFVLLAMLCLAKPQEDGQIIYIEGESEMGKVVYRLGGELKDGGVYRVYVEKWVDGVMLGVEVEGILGVDKMELMPESGEEWSSIGEHVFLGEEGEEVRVERKGVELEGVRLKLERLYSLEEYNEFLAGEGISKEEWEAMRELVDAGRRALSERGVKRVGGGGGVEGTTKRGRRAGVGSVESGIEGVALAREVPNMSRYNRRGGGVLEGGIFFSEFVHDGEGGGEGELTSSSQSVIVPKGTEKVFVDVVIFSREWPEYTGTGQYKDVVTYQIASPALRSSVAGSYDVDLLHDEFAIGPYPGGNVLVKSLEIDYSAWTRTGSSRLDLTGTATNVGDGFVGSGVAIIVNSLGSAGSFLCFLGGGGGGGASPDGVGDEGDGGGVFVEVGEGGYQVWVNAGRGEYGEGIGFFLISDYENGAWSVADLSYTGEAESVDYEPESLVPRQVTTETNVIDVVDTQEGFQIEFRNKEVPTGPAYAIVHIEKSVGQPAIISELIGGRVTEVETSQVGNSLVMTVKEGGDGLGNFERESETKVTPDFPEVGQEEEIITVRELGQVVSQVGRVYGEYDWGRVLEEEGYPDGRMTQWDYYQSGNEIALVRKMEEIHSGYEENYTYTYSGEDLVGWEKQSTWGDVADGRVETHSFDSVVPERETIEVSIDGVLVSKRFVEKTDDQLIEKEATDVSQDWSSAELVSVTDYYVEGSEFEGEIKSVSHADGTAEFYSYSINGGMKTTTVERGEPDSGGTSIVDGQREITIMNEQGGTDSRTVEDIVSGLMIESEIGSNFDDLGRAQTVTYIDGTVEHYVYSRCCAGYESQTDRSGITTTYEYDDLNRIVETMRLGIVRRTVYSGVQVMEQREGSDGSVITTSIVQNDSSGNVEWEMDAVGAQTFYSRDYSPLLGWSETTDLPPMPGQGAAMRVEEYYADGELRRVSGSAVADLEYSYGTHSLYGTQGKYVRETRLSASGGTEEWMETYYDFVGRVIAERKPSRDGSGYVEWTKEYNSKGQLIKESDPDGVVQLYAYNGKGERIQSVVDLSAGGGVGNGMIDENGDDRITETRRDYVVYQGVVCAHSVSEVYDQSGSSNRVVVSENWEGLDVNKSWVKNASGAESERETIYSGNGDWVEKVIEPGGAYSESVYVGGRRESVTRYDNLGVQVTRTSFSYDAHGRVESEIDGRIGTTTYSYTDRDEVERVNTPSGQETTTSYTQRGPAYEIELADGGVQEYSYYNTGQVLRKQGHQLYRQEYGYDEQGRLAQVSTYRKTGDVDSGGGGTGGLIQIRVKWEGDPSTTKWVYNAHRGYLEKKEYDDGRGPSYTYSAGGRLNIREWARGLVTEYLYNFAGELSDKKYWTDSSMSVADPETANIYYDYTRWGALASVEDAVGNREFFYRGSDLQLEKEIISPVAPPGESGHSVGYLGKDNEFFYEDGSETNGVVGRSQGVKMISQSTPDFFQENTYSYDEAGRIKEIKDSSTSYGAVVIPGDSYVYSYEANSNLVKSVESSVSKREYSYEVDGDRIEQVKNQRKDDQGEWVIESQFDYRSNLLDQRSDVVKSGEAFSDWDGDHVDIYEYSENGELREVKRYEGTDPENPGIEIASYAYAYRYDKVGNLESEESSGVETEYEANELNQYEREGSRDYSYDEDGNIADPYIIFNTGEGRRETVWDGENRLVQLNVVPNPGSGSQRWRFKYDYRGRMVRSWKQIYNVESESWLLGGEFEYFMYGGSSWNVMMRGFGGPSGSRHDQMYTWGLDVSGSIGRAGGVGGLLGLQDRNYGLGRYDHEYDGNGNVVGLVRYEEEGGVVSGEQAAHYEYDSYGRELVVSGDGVGLRSNKYRFSTKYLALPDLYYYGYRFYDPDTKRFLNRDPLANLGSVSSGVIARRNLEEFVGYGELLPEGPNIYAFVGNDPINRWDYLGLDMIFLLDSNAVRGNGHAAVLIGNDFHGWNYFSFGPGKNFFTARDNLDERRFSKLAEAKKDSVLKRYDKFARWKTAGHQDAKGIDKARTYRRKSYDLAVQNCEDMVYDAMIAAKVSFQKILVPVKSYQTNKEGADETGNWP